MRLSRSCGLQPGARKTAGLLALKGRWGSSVLGSTARPLLLAEVRHLATGSEVQLEQEPATEANQVEGQEALPEEDYVQDYLRNYSASGFEGISVAPFPRPVVERLLTPLESTLIEIKPDGHLYLPEIFYRRILNSSFGPGGWALMPRGQPSVKGKLHMREWALYCYGRFVSQAGGEQEQFDDAMGPSTAQEAIKSQALMRCCKDLGVASELWDPNFILNWRNQHAVRVWCENIKTGHKRQLWRRKDREALSYPWRELNSEPSAAEQAASVAPRTKSGGGGGSASASASASAPAKGSFDPDGRLPPQLKKFAGKKWSEVLATEDGRRYLQYLADNYEGGAKADCLRALAYWKSSQQSSSSAPTSVEPGPDLLIA